MSRLLLLCTALTTACAVSKHPTALGPVTPATQASVDAVLATPGVLRHEEVISARWEADLGGLLDLEDPKSIAAGKVDEKVSIVLPVHVFVHPTAGTFVVDTGVPQDTVDGGPGGVRGLVRTAAGSVEPVESLASIVARQDAPLSGVMLSHMHIDHVLGLYDVPADVPVMVGPGETGVRDGLHALTRRTYNALLDDRPPLQVWDWSQATDLGGDLRGIDVVGDGSLWAIESGGHTPGSTVFLGMTTDGPVLVLGDTSHTWFGWDNGVVPGGYTIDPDENARSLERLRALVQAHPEITVYVGHEPGR